VLSAESPERVRVDRIAVESSEVRASVRVAMGSGGLSRRDVAALAEAITAGRSVDLAASPPAAIEPWRPPLTQPEAALLDAVSDASRSEVTYTSSSPAVPAAPPEDDGSVGGDGPWGWVLGGAGVVAIGVGWAVEIEWMRLDGRVDAAEPEDPDYQTRLDARDGLVAPVADPPRPPAHHRSFWDLWDDRLGRLEPRRAYIVRKRSGRDGEPRTLREIGSVLRLSTERVRILERSTLITLLHQPWVREVVARLTRRVGDGIVLLGQLEADDRWLAPLATREPAFAYFLDRLARAPVRVTQLGSVGAAVARMPWKTSRLWSDLDERS